MVNKKISKIMKLSIIIVNYKTKNLVKQCIKNIENLHLALAYEIIVVDNASHDGIDKIVNEYFLALRQSDKLKFIVAEKNKGMGAGNNLGLQKALGEYILILNPDVVVLENSIDELVSFLDHKPMIGCVAPQLFYPNQKHQFSRYHFPKFYLPALIRTGLKNISSRVIAEYTMAGTSFNTTEPIDWARGSAMMVRAELLRKLDGFDEGFFMYLEDTDLCRRIWQIGYEVWYVPSSKMLHYYAHETNSGAWIRDLGNKLTWIHIKSWLRFFWKWKKQKIEKIKLDR